MNTEEYYSLGKISKARGLKGEVQIYLEIENPQDYKTMESVFIEINKKLVPFFIEKSIIQKNIAYLYLEGVDHVDVAQKLIGNTVFYPIAKKPENTNDDTPNLLKGYFVKDKTIGDIGTITEIQIFPSQYVASVIYQGKEVLFPLNDSFILKLDSKKQEILVDLPEGLLDIYLS